MTTCARDVEASQLEGIAVLIRISRQQQSAADSTEPLPALTGRRRLADRIGVALAFAVSGVLLYLAYMNM